MPRTDALPTHEQLTDLEAARRGHFGRIKDAVLFMSSVLGLIALLSVWGPCEGGWRWQTHAQAAAATGALEASDLALGARVHTLELRSAELGAKVDSIHEWTKELRERLIGPLPRERRP